jgi:endonuclease/exonuclease/phosphatase family metal-dependent hydrolase
LLSLNGLKNTLKLKKTITLTKLAFMFCLLQFSIAAYSQQKVHAGRPEFQKDKTGERRGDKALRVMFYNVENLFDIINDSLTADDEYTPEGMRGWTYAKFQRKINNLSKVIMRAGGWEAPEIIGLCEVENRFVLSYLVALSPLKSIGYRVIHKDSPDPRGIDVAMIYRPEKFNPLETSFIKIEYPFDPASGTRDILYVKGLVLQKDTVHFFVNHFPSRFGGYTNTIRKRNYVAGVLRSKVDSLLNIQPGCKIIIMGDFNDEPTDESISKILNAKLDSTNLEKGDLYNMMAGAGCDWKHGTIKDKEMWICIDQFIVTSSLFRNRQGVHTTPHFVQILDAPFLLQDDEAYFGQKPNRTSFGARYNGGFSDHLPIIMDLILN